MGNKRHRWLMGAGVIGLCVTVYSLLPLWAPRLAPFYVVNVWATRAVIGVIRVCTALGLHVPHDTEDWFEYATHQGSWFMLEPAVLMFVGLPSVVLLTLGYLLGRRSRGAASA